MSVATGDVSIASLSKRSVHRIRTDTGTSPRGRQTLTDETKPIDFELRFANGERLGVSLLGSGSEPASLWRVFTSIRELANLPSNWDSYGSQPLAASAVRRSFNLLPLVLSDTSPAPSVIPTRDGGVQFEWHRGGIDIEVKIPPSGSASYLIADAGTGVEQESEESLDLPAIREALERISAAQ